MTAMHVQYATRDELLEAIGSLDATMDRLRRDAGAGTSPEHEYALLALMRRLRALVGDDALALAGDLRAAALHALEAANPAPALVSLELAYCSLRGLLGRLAAHGVARAA